jgi:outer membrane receptor for ferrienterochelin and colicins
MKGNTLSLGLLLFIFNFSIAQKTNQDSLKIQEIDEVVVSAQFTPTTERNAVYKVSILNQETIQSKAVSNLTELLHQELNMDFSFSPIFGAGIELNGVSKENIKILIDGVPLIGRVNGVLNLNQINLDNIARVEIIEGPVSVFYGTDAMGGIINLITKKLQKKAITGNLSTMYESINQKNIAGNLGLKTGKGNLKFGLGHSYFNGLSTLNENLRPLNWPTRRQNYATAQYVQNLGIFKMNFSSRYSDELVQTLGKVRFGRATDIDYTTRRFDNSLNLNGNLSKNKYLNITLSYLNYDRFDTSYKYIKATDTSTLIENDPNENGNYFDTLFSKIHYAKGSKTDKLNYAIGLEYEADYAKGNRILNEKQHIKNASVYSSINYKINEKFEIQPAVRYTYNSIFKNLLSPALNIKYALNNKNIIRLAYGNGFRAPSIKELYLDWSPTFGPITYTFRGNENLDLESSTNFNLNYALHSQLNNNSSFNLNISIGYNQVKHLIGLSELEHFERHYINLNKMKSINYVIQTKFQIATDLKINLGVSYLGRYIEYSENFNSDKFMYTPAINTTINYQIKPLKTNLNIFYKYSGERAGHYIENVGGTDVLKETTRESFNNLDVNLSRSFNNKFKIHIGAKNIFDVTDIETVNQIGVAHERNSQLWGRTYFLKVDYKF